MALATIFQGRDRIVGSLDPLVGANKTWHFPFVAIDSKAKAWEALMLHHVLVDIALRDATRLHTMIQVDSRPEVNVELALV
jgi:hypothetical protein